jgi:hypothetical protein
MGRITPLSCFKLRPRSNAGCSFITEIHRVRRNFFRRLGQPQTIWPRVPARHSFPRSAGDGRLSRQGSVAPCEAYGFGLTPEPCPPNGPRKARSPAATAWRSGGRFRALRRSWPRSRVVRPPPPACAFPPRFPFPINGRKSRDFKRARNDGGRGKSQATLIMTDLVRGGSLGRLRGHYSCRVWAKLWELGVCHSACRLRSSHVSVIRISRQPGALLPSARSDSSAALPRHSSAVNICSSHRP